MQNLVLIGGLPGSGKTTIGKQPAQRIGAAFLDKDTLCNDYTEAMLEPAMLLALPLDTRPYRFSQRISH